MAERPTLRFKYHYPEEYDATFVNGALGQWNGPGEAVIHFFHERAPLPRRVDVNLDVDAAADTSVHPGDVEFSALRMVKHGIIVNRTELENLKRLITQLLADVPGDGV